MTKTDQTPALASVTPASDYDLELFFDLLQSYGCESDGADKIRCRVCFGPWFSLSDDGPIEHDPDCATVTGPAIKARIEQEKAVIAELRAERDEARATKDMHKERQEEAWVEVAALRARLAEVSEAALAVVQESEHPGHRLMKAVDALEAILDKGEK